MYQLVSDFHSSQVLSTGLKNSLGLQGKKQHFIPFCTVETFVVVLSDENQPDYFLTSWDIGLYGLKRSLKAKFIVHKFLNEKLIQGFRNN